MTLFWIGVGVWMLVGLAVLGIIIKLFQLVDERTDWKDI